MRGKTVIGLLIVLGLIGAGAAWFFGRGALEPSKLTVVSFGGAYQDAQRKAYMVPFMQKTGAKVVEGQYDGDYGVLKARATGKEGTWDVVSVESAPALRGEVEGIFEPIPDSVVQGLPLAKSARRKASVGHLMFSTILAYRTDSGNATPSTWSDFWDLKKFPGKRGLRNNPRGTLEIALLADGVPPSQLYPLDVDRAFRKLNQIRNDTVFWSSGAQPVQLLANHSVVMTSVYNGRVWDARENEHLPLGWSMHGGLLEVEFWAVPHNSANKDLAFRFIRFSLEREQQAAFANSIAYIPTNSSALDLVSERVKQALPDTSSTSDQIDVNADWWAKNEAEVSARWEQWIAAK